MTLGHRAAEPHEQTSRESRFLRHPKEPMRLAVSVPSRPMVKILDAQNSIKEQEQRKYHREVQDDDGDPDVSHSIKKRNPTACLQLRRAISVQAEGIKLLEKHAIALSAARLCYALPAFMDGKILFCSSLFICWL